MGSVVLFIMITAAATLPAGGKEFASAADAAEALRPIAGDMAFVIFAVGIIGTGLLAVPVLAGASAYAPGEAQQWRIGLNEPWRKARKFYGVIGGVMVAALALNVIDIDPMKALFWSAVLNGIMAVPVMVMMMLMASSRTIMGRFVLTPILKMLGWVATAVMGWRPSRYGPGGLAGRGRGYRHGKPIAVAPDAEGLLTAAGIPPAAEGVAIGSGETVVAELVSLVAQHRFPRRVSLLSPA